MFVENKSTMQIFDPSGVVQHSNRHFLKICDLPEVSHNSK